MSASKAANAAADIMVSALVQAIRAAGAGRTAGLRFDFQFHHAIGGKGQQLAHEVGIGPLLDQLDQGHSLVGHRHLRLQVQLATEPYPKIGDDHPGRRAPLRGAPRAALIDPSYTTPGDTSGRTAPRVDQRRLQASEGARTTPSRPVVGPAARTPVPARTNTRETRPPRLPGR